jgi:repressor LexA
MKGLTERQRAVLEYIQRSTEDSGYPPTIREIGEALGIRSTNGVNDHLKALERKGVLQRDTSKSRAIGIRGAAAGPRVAAVTREDERNESYDPPVEVAVLGRIAAGAPIEAIEQADEHVRLEPSLLGRYAREPVYALRVRGDSMIGDGIFDGDLVVVAPRVEARQGEVVAVLVDGAATVKRFYRSGDVIRLEPSNPTQQPIEVRASEARSTSVLGRVVTVIRTLH